MHQDLHDRLGGDGCGLRHRGVDDQRRQHGATTRADPIHGRRGEAGVHRAILAAWRIEQLRLITRLARMLRDVPLAEELTLQDALVAALEMCGCRPARESETGWAPG